MTRISSGGELMESSGDGRAPRTPLVAYRRGSLGKESRDALPGVGEARLHVSRAVRLHLVLHFCSAMSFAPPDPKMRKHSRATGTPLYPLASS